MNNKDRFNINDNLKITRRGKKGTWTADFNVGYTHRRVSLKTTDQATAIRLAEKMSLELAKGELKEINAKFPLMRLFKTISPKSPRTSVPEKPF